MISSENKSSEAFIENGFLSNGPLYSLLAIYMPITIFTALIFIVESYFSFSLNSAALIICSLLSGILASLYCDFMKDIKASQTAANIRGGIIIIIIFYIFSSLIRFNIPFLERFFPYFTNIISVIGALYAWIYVISLKKLFSARKRFEIYSELYQGKKLQQILYEDSAFLQYTDETINSAKYKYLAQLVIIAILAILCTIMNIKLPVSLYILLTVMFISAVLIFSFLEIIKWEHFFSAEGISLSAQDRAKRIIAAAAVTLICAGVSLFIASDKSVLPFSLITGFLLWFLSLFRSEREYVPAETPEFRMGMEMPQELMPFVESKITEEPSKIFEYIQVILKYGFILFAVILFVSFMISPLINRGKFLKKMTFGQKLFHIFKELLKGIFANIASFFNYLKQNKAMSKLRNYDAEEIRRATENLLNAYSMAKKSDVKRSATLFARLIIWGSDIRKIKWQPSHAPGEYCQHLCNVSQQIAPDDSGQDIDKLNKGIIRCGEIFEKALYSFEVLSDEERKEFKTLIEEITSSPF